jgi:hypothetical protein
MSTIDKATDTILVNRAGTDYRTTVQTMSTLADTDLLLVNRGGLDYRCTAADVKAAVGGGSGVGTMAKWTVISVTDNTYGLTAAALQQQIDAGGGFKFSLSMYIGGVVVLKADRPVDTIAGQSYITQDGGALKAEAGTNPTYILGNYLYGTFYTQFPATYTDLIIRHDGGQNGTSISNYVSYKL